MEEHDSQVTADQSAPAQVTLRQLFICVTYFAVSSAVAVRFGIGVFVLMIGVFLTWLSFRGFLSRIQTKESRPKVFGVGWLLFAASLALPAMTIKGCNNNTQIIRGWQLAVNGAVALQTPVLTVEEMLVNPEERTWAKVRDSAMQTLYAVLINLPNLMFLLSPFVLYRQQKGKGGLSTCLFGCAAMSSWSWGVAGADVNDLRIGYYVWSTAVTILFLARPPGRRTLLLMAIAGIAFLLFSWLA